MPPPPAYFVHTVLAQEPCPIFRGSCRCLSVLAPVQASRSPEWAGTIHLKFLHEPPYTYNPPGGYSILDECPIQGGGGGGE